MADISGRITRKSLKAKKKAAIKSIKAQAKDKIKEVKIQYAENPALKKAKATEREQKRAARIQRADARIAYNLRQPRQYTLAEDLFNSISHGIGAGLSVAAIVLLILRAIFYTPKGTNLGLSITSYSIFGASLFILYMMSTLYHALTPLGARKVFSILNHDAIYVLIAGTYTPLALAIIGGPAGWVIFGLAWGISAACISLYSVFGARLRSFSFVTYLVMGWLMIVLFAVFPFADIPYFSKAMLITGGVAYTVGGAFYMLRKYRWTHSIFHIFALAGSILHFFAIYYAI